MTCTLRDDSLPTQVPPTATDSRSREATFTVCLGVLGNGLCWLPLVVSPGRVSDNSCSTRMSDNSCSIRVTLQIEAKGFVLNQMNLFLEDHTTFMTCGMTKIDLRDFPSVTVLRPIEAMVEMWSTNWPVEMIRSIVGVISMSHL